MEAIGSKLTKLDVLYNSWVGVATLAGDGSSKQELNKSRLEPMIFLPSRNLGKVVNGFCKVGL